VLLHRNDKLQMRRAELRNPLLLLVSHYQVTELHRPLHVQVSLWQGQWIPLQALVLMQRNEKLQMHDAELQDP